MTGPAGDALCPFARVEIVVPRASSGSRADRFVAVWLGVSRSEVQRWMGNGRVTVGGRGCGASDKVREGQVVIVVPEGREATAAQPDAEVRFDVLYVDDEIVVVNKPPGLVVHPARGHEGGTLVNGLLARGLFRRELLEGPFQSETYSTHVRPGIVHRLDKGTSGVMVVARSVSAREALKAQFKDHSVQRAYEAVVVGVAEPRTFATMHGRHERDRLRFTSRTRSGKRAVTHVRVIERLLGATHVECTLETGRTHQIRVHLAESGTPVLGDPLYGRPPRDPQLRAMAEQLGHQALHARSLGIVHPSSGQLLRFEASPPADFVGVLVSLGRDTSRPTHAERDAR